MRLRGLLLFVLPFVVLLSWTFLLMGSSSGGSAHPIRPGHLGQRQEPSGSPLTREAVPDSPKEQQEAGEEDNNGAEGGDGQPDADGSSRDGGGLSPDERRIEAIEKRLGVTLGVASLAAHQKMTSALRSALRETGRRVAESGAHHSKDEVDDSDDSADVRLSKQRKARRAASWEVLREICVLRSISVDTSADGSGGHSQKVKFVTCIPKQSEYKPSAVAVLFHGCAHEVADFCFAKDGEPGHKCIGLAEEMGSIADAVALGYAVVAVEASRASGCWQATGFFKREAKQDTNEIANVDLVRVIEVLKEVGVVESRNKKKSPNTLSKLPLVLVGASSGGQILRHAAKAIGARVIATAALVAAPRLDDVFAEEKKDGEHRVLLPPKPPAALYAVMHRDKSSQHSAIKVSGDLNKRGHHIALKSVSDIPMCLAAAESAHTHALHQSGNHDSEFSADAPFYRSMVFVDMPKAIGPHYFHLRHPNLSESHSKAIRDGLIEAKVLETSTGFLSHDPRHRTRWRKLVKGKLKAVEGGQELLEQERSLKADKSSVAELLNVAYGMHEWNSDRIYDMLTVALCIGAADPAH